MDKHKKFPIRIFIKQFTRYFDPLYAGERFWCVGWKLSTTTHGDCTDFCYVASFAEAKALVAKLMKSFVFPDIRRLHEDARFYYTYPYIQSQELPNFSDSSVADTNMVDLVKSDWNNRTLGMSMHLDPVEFTNDPIVMVAKPQARPTLEELQAENELQYDMERRRAMRSTSVLPDISFRGTLGVPPSKYKCWMATK